MSRTANWEYGTDFALNTGDNIPSIGLGTWRVPQSQLKDTIKSAIDLGYRHFDFSTFDDASQVPGGQILGEYIHNPAYGRNQFFLSSKLNSKCLERHKILDNVESIIRELRCSHLDLLLVQYPFSLSGSQAGPQQFGLISGDFQEAWKTLETLVRDGKIKAIGVSNFNLEQLQMLCSFAQVIPAVLQLELHPYNQKCAAGLIDFCHKMGIHITAHSPFGSDEGIQQLMNDPVLINLGKKYNKTPNQIVIRWNLEYNRSVIPRTGNRQHLEDNLKVFDFELKQDDLKLISNMEKGQSFVNPEKHLGLGIGKTAEETSRTQTGYIGSR